MKKIKSCLVCMLTLIIALSIFACAKEKTEESFTLSLNASSQILTEGKKFKLEPKFSDEKTRDISWSSSDDSVATVSTDGTVSAILAGEATITAKSDKTSATCVISVIKNTAFPVLTLDTSDKSLLAGQEFKLNPKVIYLGNVVDASIKFSSSDSKIATVDEKGTITSKTLGECNIKVNMEYLGFKDFCSINLQVKEDAFIKVDKSNVKLFVKKSLNGNEPTNQKVSVESVVVLQNIISNPTINWESSNSKIATVDGSGLISAVAIGEAEVRAIYTTQASSKIYATIKVNIDTATTIVDAIATADKEWDYGAKKMSEDMALVLPLELNHIKTTSVIDIKKGNGEKINFSNTNLLVKKDALPLGKSTITLFTTEMKYKLKLNVLGSIAKIDSSLMNIASMSRKQLGDFKGKTDVVKLTSSASQSSIWYNRYMLVSPKIPDSLYFTPYVAFDLWLDESVDIAVYNEYLECYAKFGESFVEKDIALYDDARKKSVLKSGKWLTVVAKVSKNLSHFAFCLDTKKEAKSACVANMRFMSENAYNVEFNGQYGYKISFDTLENGVIASQYAPGLTKITKPNNPNAIGTHAFLGWKFNGVPFDFDNSIVVSSMNLVAYYSGEVAYRVQHYIQKSNGFILKETFTEGLSAQIGDTITADTSVLYDGYTYAKELSDERLVVGKDGAILKIYYTANNSKPIGFKSFSRVDGSKYILEEIDGYNGRKKVLEYDKKEGSPWFSRARLSNNSHPKVGSYFLFDVCFGDTVVDRIITVWQTIRHEGKEDFETVTMSFLDVNNNIVAKENLTNGVWYTAVLYLNPDDFDAKIGLDFGLNDEHAHVKMFMANFRSISKLDYDSERKPT